MTPQTPTPQSLVSLFTPIRDLRDLPLLSMHVIMAMRLCVTCATADRDPGAALEQRFASALAARRFQVLVVAIDQAWPEPFMISRPCCALLTPDEAMIGEMTVTAACANRAAFDTVARDMLSSEARDQLYIRFSAFLRAMRAGEND